MLNKGSSYRGFIMILNRQTRNKCTRARLFIWICYFTEKVSRDVKGNQAKLC